LHINVCISLYMSYIYKSDIGECWIPELRPGIGK
jgi:hypothetical protein